MFTALISLFALAVATQAIDINVPNANTVWRCVRSLNFFLALTLASKLTLDILLLSSAVNSISGGQNYISWAALPLTDPAPKTNFIDIYLRQGTGLYEPPLNVRLSSFLEHTYMMANEVPVVVDFHCVQLG